MRDLFMSYSRKNRRFVEKLVADLREHHVDVWLDTIDIEVGDPVHLTIEQAIEQSRFFCFALSPAALESYYARKVEFEAAFTRLVQERRDSFILPILIQKLTEPLPPRLAGRHYLNFTDRRQYNKNVRKLAKKVRLQNEHFTGQRWYKALDISPFGEPQGISETTQVAPTGSSVCITWEDGVVQHVDVYMNSERVNYKEFGFDSQGRVVENKMYSPDGSGGWHLVDDIWYYTYDKKTGRRAKKFMKVLGARSGRELIYNEQGQMIEENIVTDDGKPDLSYDYARKTFEYSPEGQVVRESLFDYNGKLLGTVKRTSS